MQTQPQTAPARRNAGRKRLPPRKATGVYLPLEIREAAEEIADREGIGLSPFLTRLIADALGLEAPSYCYPKVEVQEELPLNKAS
jgi:hypothetical protein